VASSKQWDSYGELLAGVAQWEPSGVVQRDALARARELPNSDAVAAQAMALLQRTWRSLPPEIRDAALDALSDAAELLAEGWDQVGGALGDVPIANIVVAGIQAVVQIAEGFSGVADVKKHASAYEKGSAQIVTMQKNIAADSTGFYTVCLQWEYAKYIKVRGGGDFDRLTALKRKGGARDSIFTGRVSPNRVKGCAPSMRRDFNDSYGPFEPKCMKQIGISALFFPWWSAAYSPGPLLRYQGSPPGAPFQAGLSPDTNGFLVRTQTALITDPAANLAGNLDELRKIVDTFQQWWHSHAWVVPLRRAGKYDDLVKDSSRSNDQRQIDMVRDPNHVPRENAGSYWFYDELGQIRPYPNQPGAGSLDDWGIVLPENTGGYDGTDNLAASLTMHNGVLSMEAAFAERRLATIRMPRLAEAIIADHGIASVDPGARAALQFSASSAANVLPYPGSAAVPKRAVANLGKLLPKPKRGVIRKPAAIGGGSTPLVLGAAAAAAFLFLPKT